MKYDVSIDEMKMALASCDLAILNNGDLMNLFLNGCKGYDNMTDAEIEVLYAQMGKLIIRNNLPKEVTECPKK